MGIEEWIRSGPPRISMLDKRRRDRSDPPVAEATVDTTGRVSDRDGRGGRYGDNVHL
jgi:hypothetical protein